MQAKQLFALESAAAVVCAVLAAASAVWPDWIERLTGMAPDAGDGGAEWGLVVGFAVAAIVAGVLARSQWKRLPAA